MAIVNDNSIAFEEKILRLGQFHFALGLPIPYPILDTEGHIERVAYMVQEEINNVLEEKPVDLTIHDTAPDFCAISSRGTHISQTPAPFVPSDLEDTDSEDAEDVDSIDSEEQEQDTEEL